MYMVVQKVGASLGEKFSQATAEPAQAGAQQNSHFLVAAKPSNSRGELSSFFLSVKSSKEGPNKHGSIYSLGHRFQI